MCFLVEDIDEAIVELSQMQLTLKTILSELKCLGYDIDNSDKFTYLNLLEFNLDESMNELDKERERLDKEDGVNKDDV